MKKGKAMDETEEKTQPTETQEEGSVASGTPCEECKGTGLVNDKQNLCTACGGSGVK